MIEAMRYSHLPKENLIDYLLTQGREGDFWDFKQEWHEHMEDLIKDILYLEHGDAVRLVMIPMKCRNILRLY